MRTSQKDMDSVVAHCAQAIRASEPLAFFCGAGISMEAPALAPDWPLLRDGVVRAALARAAKGGVLTPALARRGYYAWRAVRRRVKPEVVLHILQISLKEQLQPAYRVLLGGKPNINHRMLAQLIRCQSPVALATTNFDTYLESALAEQQLRVCVYVPKRVEGKTLAYTSYRPDNVGRRASVALLKPHGTLTAPETIRATLRAVGAPATGELRSALRRLIVDRHLFLLGYSGNDFDLFPVLHSFFPRARSVHWVCRRRQHLSPEVTARFDSGVVVEGDVAVFLRGVTEACRLAPISRVGRKEPRWRIKQRMDAGLRTWMDEVRPVDAGLSIVHLLIHVGQLTTGAALARRLVKSVGASAFERTRALNLLALCYKRSQPERALCYFEAAERALRPIRRLHLGLYGNLLGNIGGLLHETGYNRPALRYLRRSLHWAKFERSWVRVTANLIDLGSVLIATGRLDEAERLLKSAAVVLQRKGELLNLALCLNNLALCRAERGELKLAIRTMQRSLQLKERQTAGVPLLARGLMCYAEMLALTQRPGAARVFARARHMLEKLGDVKSLTRVGFGQAGLRLAAGDEAGAREVARPHEAALRQHSAWLQEDSFRKAVDLVRLRLGLR